MATVHHYGVEMAGFIAAFDSAQGLLGEASATTLAHYPDFDLQAALLKRIVQKF